MNPRAFQAESVSPSGNQGHFTCSIGVWPQSGRLYEVLTLAYTRGGMYVFTDKRDQCRLFCGEYIV